MPRFPRPSDCLTEDLTDRQAAEEGLEAIEELMIDLNLPLRLRDLKVPEEAIPGMAQGVMKVTRLLANNPRRITLEDAERIYRQCLVEIFSKFQFGVRSSVFRSEDIEELDLGFRRILIV